MFAEDEADLLLATATGARLEALVVRRVAGEPLEHLVGRVGFAGASYAVTPGVFVPRRRSELLVEQVHRTGPGVVLDLCCGSGAIGAAVSARLPDAEVWATDLDPAAVACARRNLPAGRVLLGDLYDALPDTLVARIDVVVANAPYVPTDAIAAMPSEARDHEPWLALDGGADGLDLHRRVLAGAGPWLAPGGRVVVETSRGQAAGTLAAAERCGFEAAVVTDDDLDATAVVAVSPR